MDQRRSDGRRHDHGRAAANGALDVAIVRDALVHLHDLPYLQRHPLTAWLPPAVGTRPLPSAGQRLQRRLQAAIEHLHADANRASEREERVYRLLTARYVDGLSAPSVQAKLALSKSQYYRDHEQALGAITSLLQECWTPAAAAGTAGGAPWAPRNSEPAGDTGQGRSDAPRHNLPCAITTFVGRDRELALLADMVSTSRLVTLSGTGGVGKTRLALELATRVVDRFAAGIWLVDLTPLADAQLVARTVAAVVGLPEAPDAAALAALVAALRDRQALLLLDNCEHLLDGCLPVIDAVLHGCPAVRILATSRQPFGITGELVWRVPSLGSPPGIASTPGELAGHDAVRLFVDRARLVQPGFTLADPHAAAVARICRQLDGIPLALELAAARLRVLGAAQLASRLDHALRELRGGSHTAPPRQQTLRATIDWSYDLLDDQEQQLFRHVAVFAGGWTLEAAEALGSDADRAANAVVDLLEQVADKSLVQVEEQLDGTARYRLLEPLRQYGLERLAERGETAAVEERHARYFIALAEALAPRLTSGAREPALARLETEYANLQRALGWCLAAGERGQDQVVALGLRLTGTLFWFWYFRGRVAEACHWAEALLALRAAVAPAARGQALLTAGRGAWLLGDNALARRRLAEAATLWRQVGDRQSLAHALVILGMALEAPASASAALAEATSLFRASDDAWGLALALRMQGLHAFWHNDTTACHLLEEGLALSRALGDRWFVAQTLNHLGDVARRQGDHAGAGVLDAESLALFQGQGVRGGIPSLLHNLGYVALAGGDVPLAQQRFRQSLQLFREQGDGRGVAHCLIGLASVLARPQPAVAARLFGAAERQLASIGADVGTANQGDYERHVALVQRSLPAGAFAAARTEGGALPLEEAVTLAFSAAGEGTTTAACGVS